MTAVVSPDTQEGLMHLYRFHFLNAAGVVVHNHAVRLSTRGTALKVARRMLVNRNEDDAVEIWHRNHLIHQEKRAGIAAVS